jgi:tRNA pseudouridine55 synthase
MDSGFLIINKKSGPSSHDVISELRRITGIRKIGHAGTLDPFASGVLICAVSREATKRIRKFVEMEKEYKAEIFLGAKSDTYDRTGKISDMKINPDHLDQEFVEKIVKDFIGKQKQLPPMYSAVKVRGKKLYELAREGKTSLRPPTDIEIFDIEILAYEFPKLNLKVKCSSGTYIRSLAFDIGEKLKCGAYLNELSRTKIGEFKAEDAIKIRDLTEDNWRNFLLSPSIIKY